MFNIDDERYESDKAFGKFCSLNFSNLREQLDKNELTALIWAGEFPEQRQEMSEKYPRVRTTRGAHAIDLLTLDGPSQEVSDKKQLIDNNKNKRQISEIK